MVVVVMVVVCFLEGGRIDKININIANRLKTTAACLIKNNIMYVGPYSVKNETSLHETFFSTK